jgi:hypothetical protein
MENKEKTKAEEIQDLEEAKELAMYIRGSFKWRMAYFYMRFLMVIEGFLWSFMDRVRARRMKVASRINSNYKSNR